MSSTPDHRINQLKKSPTSLTIGVPKRPASNNAIEVSLLSKAGRISLLLHTAIHSVTTPVIIDGNQFSVDSFPESTFVCSKDHGRSKLIDINGFKGENKTSDGIQTNFQDLHTDAGTFPISGEERRNSRRARTPDVLPRHRKLITLTPSPTRKYARRQFQKVPTTLSTSYIDHPKFVERPLILRAANTGLQGLSSLSGRKNQRVESLNEDAGSLCEVGLEDLDRHMKYHARLAWIFDGHGPAKLADIQSPGKLIAKAAMNVHQSAIAKRLREIIRAPVLQPEDPEFLTSSRQAIFSNAFNETQSKVREHMPRIVTKWAGSTATALFALSENQGNGESSPVSVLCSNFGDSRAIALTLRIDQNGRVSPENVYTLTREENLRVQQEKEWVFRECLRNGYRPAAIHPSAQLRQSPLRLVMVPQKTTSFDISQYEPFSSVDEVEAALAHAKKVLPPEEQYSVYLLQSPYLWKLNVRGHGYAGGLQVSGSIGDLHLEPIKKSTRTAKNVSVIKLIPDQTCITLLIVASDGLWDAVDKLNNKGSTFAHYIAEHLNQMEIVRDTQQGKIQITPGALQGVSDYLTRWAAAREKDDVTVAVLGYPNMNVTSECSAIYDRSPLEKLQKKTDHRNNGVNYLPSRSKL